MAHLGYATELNCFFEAMLQNRKTTLSFDDFTLESINIDNGIRQGETGSMILYLIYSYGLIATSQGANEDRRVRGRQLFVAIADTFNNCDNILNHMLNRQTQCLASHNSLSPNACDSLNAKMSSAPTSSTSNPVMSSIPCVHSARLLGVQINQELRWHQYAQQAVQKSEKLLLAVNRLTRPSFGLPQRHVRWLYTLIFPLPIWYTHPYI